MITRKLIEKTKNRMIESEQQAVRSAIKSGSKAVSCGRYYEGGPLVLTVEKPASWQGELWGRTNVVSCVVPADRENATIEWAQRNMTAGRKWYVVSDDNHSLRGLKGEFNRVMNNGQVELWFPQGSGFSGTWLFNPAQLTETSAK